MTRTVPGNRSRSAFPAGSRNVVLSVLTEPAPTLTEDTATNVLLEHYGIQGEMRVLASERDQNYAVTPSADGKCLLKITNSAEDPLETAFQTAALMHVERVDPGFPIPRVIRTLDGDAQVAFHAEDGRDHTIRLLSWLEGTPLAAIESEPDIATHMGTVLARLGIALEHFEHPGSGHSLLWDLKHAVRLNALLPNVRDEELRALCRQCLLRFAHNVQAAMRRLRSQVIFNDCNPSNLLVRHDCPQAITGIIDFGDMVKSPLIVDVAVGAAYLCRSDADPLADAAKFVSGFHRVRPLLDAEIDLLVDLIMTRHVMTILITHWRAEQYPDNRQYIMRNEPRARRTIERLANMQPAEGTDTFHTACGD